MKTKISPLPWAADQDAALIYSDHPDADEVICDTSGLAIDAAFFSTMPGRAEANAAFIVRACNSHAALVAACKQLVSEMPERWRTHPQEFSGANAANMARKALTLAGEK